MQGGLRNWRERESDMANLVRLPLKCQVASEGRCYEEERGGKEGRDDEEGGGRASLQKKTASMLSESGGGGGGTETNGFLV